MNSDKALPLRRRKVIRRERPFLASVPGDLRSLASYRNLFSVMTTTRLKIRYRQSVLGWLWAVLQPLALMVLYAAIFSHAVGYDTAPVPYPLFLLAGLLPWSFCSTALSTAATAMLTHNSLMAKVYFPREIVPLSHVAAALFDLMIASLLLLAMMLIYRVPISPVALIGVPIAAILALHTGATSLLLASLQIHVRDINVALPLVLQVFMFTAPVVYPAMIVPPSIQAFYWMNPLAILISDFRLAVLGRAPPNAGGLLYCLLLGLVFFLFAYSIFKWHESKIVDEM
jgi:lipopolysaccharide transport system permease protein